LLFDYLDQLLLCFRTVRTLLSTNPFVHVYSFDFSKAFDTVRHCTLMDKMAQMQLTDNVYNWIKRLWRTLSLYKIRRWTLYCLGSKVQCHPRCWSESGVVSGRRSWLIHVAYMYILLDHATICSNLPTILTL